MSVGLSTAHARAACIQFSGIFGIASADRRIQSILKVFGLMLFAASVSGCWFGPTPLTEPERLFPVEQELAPVRAAYSDDELWRRYVASPSAPLRNDIITARMYAIDLNYTRYEARLGEEGMGVEWATALINQGLTLAVPIIPWSDAKNAVSAVASGAAYLGTAYNEKLLLKQAITHVQNGMRQARYEQAAVILANMKCDIGSYPLGLAMSDVEIYYRAGTFSSGLIKVNETVANAATDAKATKDNSTPARPRLARARLAANAEAALVRADPGPQTDCKSVQLGPDDRSSPGFHTRALRFPSK